MRTIILSLMILAVTSCSTHLTDLSVLSNKNVSLDKLDIDKAPHIKNVSGKDTVFVLLFFSLGEPQLKTALNNALKQADGDMMIDVSIYAKSWWFFVGQRTLEIQGTVVKTRENN